jgi:hypothetical protein
MPSPPLIFAFPGVSRLGKKYKGSIKYKDEWETSIEQMAELRTRLNLSEASQQPHAVEKALTELKVIVAMAVGHANHTRESH